MRIHSAPAFALAFLTSAFLCLGIAAPAAAEPAAMADSTPTAHDAEFMRFMERSLAQKPAAAAPQAAGATCDAPSQAARNFATLKQMEAELARLRAEQKAKWAKNGWSPKEAAKNGEAVVLNGSGYNIRNGVAGQ